MHCSTNNRTNDGAVGANLKLEEIIRNVTSEQFCEMPWKCVTMAVLDKVDPYVKKSFVHVHRNCVGGQNIFDVKVHNCRKDVCDHAICTKKCETNDQRLSDDDSIQKESFKRNRKKIKKSGILNDCTVTPSSVKKGRENQPNRSKDNDLLTTKKGFRNLKKDEECRLPVIEQADTKAKPSCTLRIFTEGKARKLNFQLHPAMEVFLEKAIDKIECQKPKKVNAKKKESMTIRQNNHQGEFSDVECIKNENSRKTLTNIQDGENVKGAESLEEFQDKLPNSTEFDTEKSVPNAQQETIFKNVKNHTAIGYPEEVLARCTIHVPVENRTYDVLRYDTPPENGEFFYDRPALKEVNERLLPSGSNNVGKLNCIYNYAAREKELYLDNSSERIQHEFDSKEHNRTISGLEQEQKSCYHVIGRTISKQPQLGGDVLPDAKETRFQDDPHLVHQSRRDHRMLNIGNDCLNRPKQGSHTKNVNEPQVCYHCANDKNASNPYHYLQRSFQDMHEERSPVNHTNSISCREECRHCWREPPQRQRRYLTEGLPFPEQHPLPNDVSSRTYANFRNCGDDELEGMKFDRGFVPRDGYNAKGPLPSSNSALVGRTESSKMTNTIAVDEAIAESRDSKSQRNTVMNDQRNESLQNTRTSNRDEKWLDKVPGEAIANDQSYLNAVHLHQTCNCNNAVHSEKYSNPHRNNARKPVYHPSQTNLSDTRQISHDALNKGDGAIFRNAKDFKSKVMTMPYHQNGVPRLTEWTSEFSPTIKNTYESLKFDSMERPKMNCNDRNERKFNDTGESFTMSNNSNSKTTLQNNNINQQKLEFERSASTKIEPMYSSLTDPKNNSKISIRKESTNDKHNKNVSLGEGNAGEIAFHEFQHQVFSADSCHPKTNKEVIVHHPKDDMLFIKQQNCILNSSHNNGEQLKQWYCRKKNIEVGNQKKSPKTSDTKENSYTDAHIQIYECANELNRPNTSYDSHGISVCYQTGGKNAIKCRKEKEDFSREINSYGESDLGPLERGFNHSQPQRRKNNENTIPKNGLTHQQLQYKQNLNDVSEVGECCTKRTDDERTKFYENQLNWTTQHQTVRSDNQVSYTYHQDGIPFRGEKTNHRSKHSNESGGNPSNECIRKRSHRTITKVQNGQQEGCKSGGSGSSSYLMGRLSNSCAKKGVRRLFNHAKEYLGFGKSFATGNEERGCRNDFKTSPNCENHNFGNDFNENSVVSDAKFRLNHSRRNENAYYNDNRLDKAKPKISVQHVRRQVFNENRDGDILSIHSIPCQFESSGEIHHDNRMDNAAEEVPSHPPHEFLEAFSERPQRDFEPNSNGEGSDEEKYKLHYNNFYKRNAVSERDIDRFDIIPSDSDYDYSSENMHHHSESETESEGEKAKNWLINGRRGESKPHRRKKRRRDKSISVTSFQTGSSRLQKFKFSPGGSRFDDPLVTTMAFNPYRLESHSSDEYCKMNKVNTENKNDGKLSDYVTNSLRNSYNKVKVIIRRNDVTEMNNSAKKELKNKTLDYIESLSHDIFTSVSSINITKKKSKNSKRGKNKKGKVSSVEQEKKLTTKKNNVTLSSNSSISVQGKTQPQAWYSVISGNGGRTIQKATETQGIKMERNLVSHREEGRAEARLHYAELDSKEADGVDSSNECRETNARSSKCFTESTTSGSKDSSTSGSKGSTTSEMGPSSQMSGSTNQTTQRGGSAFDEGVFQSPLADPQTGFCPLLPN